VNSKGYKIHYLEWGKSGDQILSLHSMGMDVHGLDSFSTVMSSEYQMLALDLPGHGESDAPKGAVTLEELAEIVRGVALERTFKKNILIGHSIGGSISMVYADQVSDEVNKVVLVDIAPMEMAAPRRPAAPMAPPPESFSSEEEALTCELRFSPFSCKTSESSSFVKEKASPRVQEKAYIGSPLIPSTNRNEL